MVKIRIAKQNTFDRRSPRLGRRLRLEAGQLRPEVRRGIYQDPPALVGGDGNTALRPCFDESASRGVALPASTIPLRDAASGWSIERKAIMRRACPDPLKDLGRRSIAFPAFCLR